MSKYTGCWFEAKIHGEWVALVDDVAVHFTGEHDNNIWFENGKII